MKVTYYACVDIGGTKVAVSLVAANGAPINQHTALLAKRTEPTIKTGAHTALPRQMIRMIDEACTSLHATRAQVVGVGVSSCGPFLSVAGQLELVASNICGGKSGLQNNDWHSIALERELRKVFPVLQIENDAVAALLAEVAWGALQGTRHAAYITWSTGIGAGLYVDGRVLRGKNGNAGHAGHMIVGDALCVHNQALVCGCGNVGDVQSQAAGSGIPKRFGMPSADLMRLAQSGDKEALRHVDLLCEDMARALYNLTAVLDLERIALGGSVFWHNQALLLPRLQAGVMRRFPAMTQGLTIVPAGLGLDVANYGALAALMGAPLREQ
ncbi:MAG: ROK family protein [Cytophagales bacterium]|nr:ROK family protein [Cytophagales bacterium]